MSTYESPGEIMSILYDSGRGVPEDVGNYEAPPAGTTAASAGSGRSPPAAVVVPVAFIAVIVILAVLYAVASVVGSWDALQELPAAAH